MKKILVLAMAVIFLAVGFVFIFRDWLIKTGLESTVTKLTGLRTKVGMLRFDFPSTILIRDLTIKNPPGFHEKLFANFPEIFISLDLGELLRRERIHLREVRLHLEEVHIEKNQKGVSNISLLKPAAPTEKKAKPQAAPAAPGKAMPFLLDRMELTLRRVSFEDRSALIPGGGLPGKIMPKTVTETFGKAAKEVIPSEIAQKKFSADLNIQKQVFTNINKPETIVQIILLKILSGQTLDKLKSFKVDPNELVNTLDLQKTLKSVRASGEEVFQQASGLLTQKTGGTFKEAQSQVAGLLGKFGKTEAAK